MPAQIYETFASGNGTFGGTNPSRELQFTLTGSESTADAQAAVEGTIPALWNGLYFQDYSLEHLGAGVWTATARYGPRPKPDVGTQPVGSNTSPRLTGDQREPALNAYTESFETTGGTTKKMQSLATARYAPDGYIAPDFKGAIGVNGDNVDGVEVTTPAFNFTETWHLPTAAVTGAYKKTLYALTGKTNNALWRGFEGGELLFLGASGSVKWDDGWEVTYKFACQPNAINLQVGDITVTTKLGFEYMWVRYESSEDAAAKSLVVRPKAVYVERVYDSADFGLLGLGV
jgi:hypothetical protein